MLSEKDGLLVHMHYKNNIIFFFLLSWAGVPRGAIAEDDWTYRQYTVCIVYSTYVSSVTAYHQDYVFTIQYMHTQRYYANTLSPKEIIQNGERDYGITKCKYPRKRISKDIYTYIKKRISKQTHIYRKSYLNKRIVKEMLFWRNVCLRKCIYELTHIYDIYDIYDIYVYLNKRISKETHK